MYKYLEIKKYENNEVVKRIDVSDSSDRTIERVESGMNMNLNHEQYYVFSYESEAKLKTIN